MSCSRDHVRFGVLASLVSACSTGPAPLDPGEPFTAAEVREAWGHNEVSDELQAILEQVPAWVPPPMRATYRYQSGGGMLADAPEHRWQYDLATRDGRLRTVLECVRAPKRVASKPHDPRHFEPLSPRSPRSPRSPSEREPERKDPIVERLREDPSACDLSGMLLPAEAVRRSKGTRSDEVPYVQNLRWMDLVSTCPAPKVTEGFCGGPIHVDALTGECRKGDGCTYGRPFAGGRQAEVLGESSPWARVAAAEHASIAAFARHVEELRAVGAPEALVEQARAAQDDEAHHTALALSLARRGGAPVELGPLDTDVPIRTDLEAVLVDVATHGCVDETLSAVQCAFALEQATDPDERAVLAVLVRDETQHAALAWRTLVWGLGELDAAAGERVRAVLRDAMEGQQQPARVWGRDHVLRPALALVA